jgi:methionine-rich copper-binding protein CopC
VKLRSLAAAALTLCATPAFAHAFLEHASPGAGAALAAPPKQLALSFTEKLEPHFSGVTVTDTDGHDEEAAGAVIDGTSVTVALKPLTPGTYHVAWHAVSVDTHRTDGAYSFTVKP